MKTRPTAQDVEHAYLRAHLDEALDVIAGIEKEWGPAADFYGKDFEAIEIINQGREVLRKHGRMS